MLVAHGCRWPLVLQVVASRTRSVFPRGNTSTGPPRVGKAGRRASGPSGHARPSNARLVPIVRVCTALTFEGGSGGSGRSLLHSEVTKRERVLQRAVTSPWRGPVTDLRRGRPRARAIRYGGNWCLRDTEGTPVREAPVRRWPPCLSWGGTVRRKPGASHFRQVRNLFWWPAWNVPTR
jgi:hypothetical protein